MVTFRALGVTLLTMFVAFLLVILGADLGVRRTNCSAPVPVQSVATGVPDPEPATPGLRVRCRNDERCVKTTEVDWKDGQGPIKRRFLRLLVYNNGPGTAEACTVQLRSVTAVTRDGVTPSAFNAPSLLIWSGERSARGQGWDITAGLEPGIADLLYTVHQPSGDVIVLKDESYSSKLRFDTTYRFELVVTGENARAVYKTVMVRFGTAWNDFQVLSD
jgi:hypothetical protein